METIDNLKELIIANPYPCIHIGLWIMAGIIIFFIGRKALKYNRENHALDIENKTICEKYHMAKDEIAGNNEEIGELCEDYCKLQKEYDTLLHIKEGNEKRFREQFSLNETKILAMEFTRQLLKTNRSGYTTENVAEMFDVIADKLKK